MEKVPEDQFSYQCIFLSSHGSCWIFWKAIDLPSGSTMGKGPHTCSLDAGFSGMQVTAPPPSLTLQLGRVENMEALELGPCSKLSLSTFQLHGLQEVVLPLGLSFLVCKLGLA